MIRTRINFTWPALTFCLGLATALSPAWCNAQAISSGASTVSGSAASKPASAAQGGSPTSSSGTTSNKTTASSGKPSSADIAAAKASGQVWVNTETRVFHKEGRWYGKTKQGKFMTESEAKAAGYKEAKH